MLAWLERFSDTHQHTIAALEATSTFAAVVASLALALLAHRSSRTRIRAWVKVSFIVHQTLEGKPKPEYLTVTLRLKHRCRAVFPSTLNRVWPTQQFMRIEHVHVNDGGQLSSAM